MRSLRIFLCVAAPAALAYGACVGAAFAEETARRSMLGKPPTIYRGELDSSDGSTRSLNGAPVEQQSQQGAPKEKDAQAPATKKKTDR